MTDIAVIILQKNEVLHIGRCLEKLAPLEPREIFVVDCFSTDGSDETAARMGAKVIRHAWPGLYAPQYNWAAENCPISAGWILRLDADEYLLPETIVEIRQRLPSLASDVSGVIFKRRNYVGWLGGKWLKRGMYPTRLLRLYRRGKGICEERYMDEHIRLSEGRVVEFDGDFVDHNLNSFEWWKEKHLGYAKREAMDARDILAGKKSGEAIGRQAGFKRVLKKAYYHIPPYVRPTLYFAYRFLVKGAVWEGPAAWRWCWHHAFWYRLQCDREIAALKKMI